MPNSNDRFFEKLFMVILFTLRISARNLLKGNRRRNTFCILFDVWLQEQFSFSLWSQLLEFYALMFSWSVQQWFLFHTSFWWLVMNFILFYVAPNWNETIFTSNSILFTRQLAKNSMKLLCESETPLNLIVFVLYLTLMVFSFLHRKCHPLTRCIKIIADQRCYNVIFYLSRTEHKF